MPCCGNPHFISLLSQLLHQLAPSGYRADEPLLCPEADDLLRNYEKLSMITYGEIKFLLSINEILHVLIDIEFSGAVASDKAPQIPIGGYGYFALNEAAEASDLLALPSAADFLPLEAG